MKHIIPLILSLIVGFLLAYYVINQYQDKEKLKTVFEENTTVNFFQYGVYSSEENMKANTLNLNYYIYTISDNKYYVYVGAAKSIEATEKLKGYFKDLKYDIYVKEINIKDISFISELEQYDLLLKETSDKDVIKSICSQILAKYEEMIDSN